MEYNDYQRSINGVVHGKEKSTTCMIQRSGDQSYLLAGFKEKGSVFLPWVE
jgi:hypothetical protein